MNKHSLCQYYTKLLEFQMERALVVVGFTAKAQVRKEDANI